MNSTKGFTRSFTIFFFLQKFFFQKFFLGFLLEFPSVVLLESLEEQLREIQEHFWDFYMDSTGFFGKSFRVYFKNFSLDSFRNSFKSISIDFFTIVNFNKGFLQKSFHWIFQKFLLRDSLKACKNSFENSSKQEFFSEIAPAVPSEVATENLRFLQELFQQFPQDSNKNTGRTLKGIP